MKTYKYDPKFNFHNQPPIRLKIDLSQAVNEPETLIVLSKSQAKRIRKHFCGVTGCQCNGGQTYEIEPGVECIAVSDLTEV